MLLSLVGSIQKKTRCLHILVPLFVYISSSAQWHKDIGGSLATNGIGISMGIERPTEISSWSNRLSLTLSNLKHPRESKSQNTQFVNTRPYIYLKTNSLYMGRLSYGWKKTISKSQNEKPQLSFGLFAGPSLGITKPYYVGYENTEGNLIIGIQNQETLENQDKIQGPARRSNGLNELESHIGIHLDCTFNVKWNHSLFYNYWQTGVRIDFLPQGVNLMYGFNSKVFTGLYTTYSFGRK